MIMFDVMLLKWNFIFVFMETSARTHSEWEDRKIMIEFKPVAIRWWWRITWSRTMIASSRKEWFFFFGFALLIYTALPLLKSKKGRGFDGNRWYYAFPWKFSFESITSNPIINPITSFAEKRKKRGFDGDRRYYAFPWKFSTHSPQTLAKTTRFECSIGTFHHTNSSANFSLPYFPCIAKKKPSECIKV